MKRSRFLQLLAVAPILARLATAKALSAKTPRWEWVMGPMICTPFSRPIDGPPETVIYGELREIKTGRIVTWCKKCLHAEKDAKLAQALADAPLAADHPWPSYQSYPSNYPEKPIRGGKFERGILTFGNAEHRLPWA